MSGSVTTKVNTRFPIEILGGAGYSNSSSSGAGGLQNAGMMMNNGMSQGKPGGGSGGGSSDSLSHQMYNHYSSLSALLNPGYISLSCNYLDSLRC